jgi:TPR repeat protein
MNLGELLTEDADLYELMCMLCPFKLYRELLSRLQLCDSRGVLLHPFPRTVQCLPCPFKGNPVYNMPLTRMQRLRILSFGHTAKLVRLLTSYVGGFKLSECTGRSMAMFVSRQMASNMGSGVLRGIVANAENFIMGQCAVASRYLLRATWLGHMPSRAQLAWILVAGREGVVANERRAFELAQEGVDYGCVDCMGVLSYCLLFGVGCSRSVERSLELAQYSAERCSRYGQYMLGCMYHYGATGFQCDIDAAAEYYRLSASQHLDAGLRSLGFMHFKGWGVAQDYAKALQLYRLAADQGDGQALYNVADFYNYNHGGVFSDTSHNTAEALRYYRLAHAAGYHLAAIELSYLSQ